MTLLQFGSLLLDTVKDPEGKTTSEPWLENCILILNIHKVQTFKLKFG